MTGATGTVGAANLTVLVLLSEGRVAMYTLVGSLAETLLSIVSLARYDGRRALHTCPILVSRLFVQTQISSRSMENVESC